MCQRVVQTYFHLLSGMPRNIELEISKNKLVLIIFEQVGQILPEDFSRRRAIDLISVL